MIEMIVTKCVDGATDVFAKGVVFVGAIPQKVIDAFVAFSVVFAAINQNDWTLVLATVAAVICFQRALFNMLLNEQYDPLTKENVFSNFSLFIGFLVSVFFLTPPVATWLLVAFIVVSIDYYLAKQKKEDTQKDENQKK